MTFVQAVSGSYVLLSTNNDDRIAHAHGQTNEDVFTLRSGEFERLPDGKVHFLFFKLNRANDSRGVAWFA